MGQGQKKQVLVLHMQKKMLSFVLISDIWVDWILLGKSNSCYFLIYFVRTQSR